ncbi:YheC/YheD family protein [Brevibacillus migulae]|uniref:YheC/YheD family protein n=1 Tax=Brevibacillus migulae TaxID=1644114 RepID=UPI00106E6165|nr:YheC/YheD family protein [Brevibacillus migulae]
MAKRYLRIASSKWHKWKIVKNAGYSHIQPNTSLYSHRTLMMFLRRYGTVFVKPDRGYGGSDVISIQRENSGYTAIEQEGKKAFADSGQLHAWIESIRKGRRFIVQQGIDLQPLHGSPVDIRTILQKNEQGEWEVTGLFAKAAKKGKVVTNVKAGGRVLRVSSYLSQVGRKGAGRRATLQRLKQLSRQVARAFHAHYTNRVYALDIGLDRSGKLWLIEVNTHPSFTILKRIDHRMYQRAIKLRRKRPS